MKLGHASWLMGLAVVGASAVVGGCNIVAPAAYLIAGPEKTPAAFKLDEKRTTVVFVDDRRSVVPRRALRVTMAEQAQNDLLKERVVKDMISAQSAIQAAGRDGPSGPVSVTEIGRNVKADIVIFATVDSFSLSPDGTSYRPVAVLRVRVIDVTKDERIWPASEEGLPVRVSLPPKTGDAPQSVGEVYKAEEELARAAGVQLAKVFYKHETARGPRDPG